MERGLFELDKKANDLTATYTVDFSGKKDLYQAFFKTWNGVYDYAGNKWTFNDQNHTATLIFKKGQS